MNMTERKQGGVSLFDFTFTDRKEKIINFDLKTSINVKMNVCLLFNILFIISFSFLFLKEKPKNIQLITSKSKRASDKTSH